MLITGASLHIGGATARVLADEEANVVLGPRKTDRPGKIVEEIREAGSRAESEALDVTDKQPSKNFVSFVKDRFGQVDVN